MDGKKTKRFQFWRPLRIGIELDDDLRVPLSPSDREALKLLFEQHSLLVFHNQFLTHERQIQILEILGPVLRSQPDGVGMISTEEGKGDLGSYELAFHSDLAFTPKPFRAISLHAVDVVDGATSTKFSSGIRACRNLPAELRAKLSGLNLISAMPTDNACDQVGRDIPEGMPFHSWPLLMSHPATDEMILYASQQQAVYIEGVPRQESDRLIRELFAYLYAPDNIYEHPWMNGDMVIWDNLALTHARGNLVGCGRRTLQRVVVAERGFYEQCPQFDPYSPDFNKWLNAKDQSRGTTDLSSVLNRAKH